MSSEHHDEQLAEIIEFPRSKTVRGDAPKKEEQPARQDDEETFAEAVLKMTIDFLKKKRGGDR